jgi:prepilin-type N-terminal cleavage/methylation domain-containing protein
MDTTHHRRGYTLIELLTVIAIIGLLIALGSAAAMMALQRGRITAIGIDVQTLNAAVHSYKSDRMQYPPDMSDVNYANRQTRFQNHIGLVYPRCGISYATLKSYILNNYQRAYGYNYKGPGGNLAPLNLDTLDQAEALVFWLGGFPTPYTNSGVLIGPTKLFGFHLDGMNPFRLDSGSGTNPANRSAALADFDDARLVDNDQDGWLEYIPPSSAPGTNGKTPPYVYFDAGGYTQAWPNKVSPPFAGYPMQRAGDPNSQMGALSSAWGIAVPYAQDFTNVDVPIPQWVGARTFQIISAGFDGAYGKPGTVTMRIPCFPAGATFRVPGLNQGYYDFEELDNVTSFTSRGTIEDSAP